ncbi:MAG: hypothetical protein HQK63_06295 [Desulfamplus sp.]|nr:hypothetical protein [Desulfamplus sp.]
MTKRKLTDNEYELLNDMVADVYETDAWTILNHWIVIAHRDGNGGIDIKTKKISEFKKLYQKTVKSVGYEYEIQDTPWDKEETEEVKKYRWKRQERFQEYFFEHYF